MPASRVSYLLGVLAAVTVAACASPSTAQQPPASSSSAEPAPTTSSAAPSTVDTTTSAAPATSAARPAGAPVVVLDPGHNGNNTAEINKLVPAGRGRTKPCNTGGTSTNAGYPEHAFTFDVASRVRDLLGARGVKVIMTRPDDNGSGPCVNERAATGNRAGATAVVSIHADGATSPGAHGFHVIYSNPPLNAAQGEPSQRLARTMRDALRGAGFATSTYIGADGLSPRDDLAGLNLSERPAIMVECGNMRDAAEAAVLSSPAGRQRYADVIAAAIMKYLS